MKPFLTVCICLVTLAAAPNALAQVERVLPSRGSSSLEGTSFIVGFMQNEILAAADDPRLQIFISSQYDATVTINYPTFGPQVRRVPANTVHVEDVSTYHVVNVSEVVQQKSIAITSDVPIVVYVLNTLAASTDTYTAIPIKHLGTQYLTVNAPADRYAMDPNSNSTLDTMIRLSEFMIIGVEPFTDVTITPKVRTETGSPAGIPFTVRLNKGDCYLVKSGHTPAGFGDQSGSRINATAPVAVLSGHQRSSMPGNIGYSKDHLIEMLPPMQTWGKEYVTTPFELVSTGDIIRLMSAAPNTRIDIETASGGASSVTITNAGDWIDLRLREAAYYKSDQAFFVMQFMPSRTHWLGTSPNYDPAMVVVPPLDQYIAGALLQFPRLESQRPLGDEQRFYHWINVVAERAALPTLRVNSWLVTDLAPELELQPVPGTDMFWASVRLARGSYTITADTGLFSGVMYGSTNADSYANLFGVSYDPVDQSARTPPVYDMSVDCGDIEGTVTDISNGIPLLEEVTVQSTKTFNYRWSLSNPLDTVGTIRIIASVVDRWKDARFVIHGYDDEGNGREWLYDYDAPDLTVPRKVTITSSSTSTVCVRVPIVNNDSTTTTARQILLSGDERITLARGTLLDEQIGPGDTLWVEVCYTPVADNESASSTLLLDFGCGLTKTVDITTEDLSSILTENLDFGDIRVGDTSCLPVPIVNDGVLDIVIDSIALGDNDDLTPDLTGITFPVTLKSGDTLWIPVCFTPVTRGPQFREDTVLNSASSSSTFTTVGNGVAPNVRNIVIDWGKRRVGIRSDTLAQLINDGDGRCFVSTASPVDLITVFDSAPFPIGEEMAASTATALALAFTPDQVGLFADTIPMDVDWSLHEEVSIILIGEGTLPEFTTIDIDMGDVIVGEWKDSLVTVGQVLGTEQVSISSVVVVGPDEASFTVPNSIVQTGVVAGGTDIADILRFTPQRLGVHRMEIEYYHDAAPAFAETMSKAIITGNGINRPIIDVRITFAIPEPLAACVSDTTWMSISNEGTEEVSLNEITIQVNAQSQAHDIVLPYSLAPSATLLVPVQLLVEYDQLNTFSVDVRHSDTVIVTSSTTFSATSEAPVVDLLPLANDHATAGVPIIVDVTSVTERNIAELVSLEILIDEDRWKQIGADILVAIDDVRGSRSVPATVDWSATRGLVEMVDSVQSPYRLKYRLDGVALWKDVAPVDVTARVLQTRCGPQTEDTETMTIDECGGDLRAISFDALPIVEGRVTSLPAGDFISIELKTTKNALVDIDVVDVNGQRKALARKYSLQTGAQLCNFSSMPWATGRYVVVVKHETGEVVLPLVLVK